MSDWAARDNYQNGGWLPLIGTCNQGTYEPMVSNLSFRCKAARALSGDYPVTWGPLSGKGLVTGFLPLPRQSGSRTPLKRNP